MAGLDTGIPIGRRKRNVPEARCGLCKFQRDLGRSNQALLHGDHATLQLLPAVWVLHLEPLPGHYHVR